MFHSWPFQLSPIMNYLCKSPRRCIPCFTVLVPHRYHARLRTTAAISDKVRALPFRLTAQEVRNIVDLSAAGIKRPVSSFLWGLLNVGLCLMSSMASASNLLTLLLLVIRWDTS